MKEHAKKALKHDIKVAGKTVPTMLIIGLFLVGGGSAAILTNFGTVTGEADVTQAIQIDGSMDGSLTEGTASLNFLGESDTPTVTGGETEVDTFTVDNNMDSSYDLEFTSYPGESTTDSLDSADSVEQPQFVWSDAGSSYTSGIRTTFANYFVDAGATHDSSSYEAPFTREEADLVVDPTDGTGDYNKIQAAVDNLGDSEDKILVRDGDYSSEWVGIDESVTIASENLHGATVGRFTVKSSDVTIKGFEVVGDGANYNGISVEPKNGATSGVIIEDNHIHNVYDRDTTDSNDKKDASGIMAWSSGEESNALDSLTIRNNIIEDIGSDSNNAQGFGIFIEGIGDSSSNDGVTIEDNEIQNINSATIDGDNYPGVAVAVLPELTAKGASTGDSAIVTDNANVELSNNVLDATVDLSLAGDVSQFRSQANRFEGEINVLAEGNSEGAGSFGIYNLDSSSLESVTSNTDSADLDENFFADGIWEEADNSNLQGIQESDVSYQTVESVPAESEMEVAAVNEFSIMLNGNEDPYSLSTTIS